MKMITYVPTPTWKISIYVIAFVTSEAISEIVVLNLDV
jgi:hypothetical protein